MPHVNRQSQLFLNRLKSPNQGTSSFNLAKASLFKSCRKRYLFRSFSVLAGQRKRSRNLFTNFGGSHPKPVTVSPSANTTTSNLFVLTKKVFGDSDGAKSGNQHERSQQCGERPKGALYSKLWGSAVFAILQFVLNIKKFKRLVNIIF